MEDSQGGERKRSPSEKFIVAKKVSRNEFHGIFMAKLGEVTLSELISLSFIYCTHFIQFFVLTFFLQASFYFVRLHGICKEIICTVNHRGLLSDGN